MVQSMEKSIKKEYYEYTSIYPYIILLIIEIYNLPLEVLLLKYLESQLVY